MKRLIPFIIAACLCFAGCSDFSNYESETAVESTSTTQYDSETTTEYTTVESILETTIEIATSTTEDESVNTMITVPDASYMCEGKHYSEVVEMFENAGFTNVSAIPLEVDYNKETNFDGCVVIVSVNDDAYFETDAMYDPDVNVRVNYVIVPKESELQTTVTMNDDKDSVTVPLYSENEGDLVWVPTNGGTKYHSRSGCSNMKDPIQVTKDTAIANGYTPCGRCY